MSIVIPPEAVEDLPAGDVAGGSDSAGVFASNQSEAARALGIAVEEWDQLRQQDGFPSRTAKGWDVEAIRAWLGTGDPSVEFDDADDALPAA
ncbi:MAG: hypothetical protein AB7U20_25090 [Planctomycetaceae bacterium]